MQDIKMYTIIETAKFEQLAKTIWNEEERSEFFTFLAQNPLAGDVIPHSQGLRKIRWQANSKGKRGGARVIYFNVLEAGVIVMLDIYIKNEKENISTLELKKFKGQKNEFN